jgi:hypothetical protein
MLENERKRENMNKQERIGNTINVLDLGELIAAINDLVETAKTLAENRSKYFAYSIAVNITSVDLFEETLSDGSKVYNLELQ